MSTQPPESPPLARLTPFIREMATVPLQRHRQPRRRFPRSSPNEDEGPG